MANNKGDNSETSSNVELPAVTGLNKNSQHPEEWTLPHEWNMEKRELFEEKSLEEYPNPDAGKYFNYDDERLKAEFEKQRRLYARYAGGTLNYGLHRLPEKAYPDKY
ncbi:hypothetical protein FSP39_024159 [Pinctada imbricata]|uniref:Uncharacterized protein n=1 Tax=Pinctada imbricata TaxID=66713 RepID=A0AA88Y1G1_PINIB|nr:hypothetical protein FSP39_024159 [Pinctada imbricata]